MRRHDDDIKNRELTSTVFLTLLVAIVGGVSQWLQIGGYGLAFGIGLLIGVWVAESTYNDD